MQADGQPGNVGRLAGNGTRTCGARVASIIISLGYLLADDGMVHVEDASEKDYPSGRCLTAIAVLSKCTTFKNVTLRKSRYHKCRSNSEDVHQKHMFFGNI